MIITKLDIPLIPPGSGVPRTAAADTGKLHLSDIAHYIEYKMKYGPKKQANDWDLPWAGEVGFMWEDVLSLVMGERNSTRVGEIECEGIVGSPDGIGPDPLGIYPIVNVEDKCTWRSSNKTPDMIWYWTCQFKSYCYMLGVTVTILRALYLMGDYRGSGPQALHYRLEFTAQDLVENWAMIKAHEAEMKEKGFLDIKQVKGENQ